MTTTHESEFRSRFELAIATASSGGFEGAVEHFEAAVATWSDDDAGGPFTIDGVDENQNVFMVIHYLYRPALGEGSPLLEVIKDAVLNSDWSAALSSIFADSVLVPTLMLARNGDRSLWEAVRSALPLAMRRVDDAAIGKSRYLANVAFLSEAAGDDDFANQVFAEVHERLNKYRNCMCGTPGCTAGLAEWLARFGK